MPISLQSDAILPQGHILVDGQRVASFSTTGGLSATIIRANEFVGLGGIPVGAVVAFPTNTSPSGWLKLNGAEILRSDFAALWAFAQISGNLVTEATWSATNQGSFSTGNTTTTFRLPDLRGEFIRGWADNRAIDTGRGIGTYQTDAFQGHWHVIKRNSGSTHPGGTPWQSWDSTTSSSPDSTVNAGMVHRPLNDSVNGEPRTAAETRPRNIAHLYCIKY